MSYVEVDKLWLKYGNFMAVKNLSFTIPKGEVFGFIGPNGAGKSSTIKMLATLLKPFMGTAFIDKVNVARFPNDVRRMIGYVPDFFGVYEDLTVNEYLHFFAAAYRIELHKRQKIIDDVLELTDLTDKKDAMVDSLSRGMKQRLSLARVLVHDPPFLLLDEPASGLDPRARIEIRELLKELKNMGKTILISSHILSELGEICTRIGIIEQGKMVAEGSLNDIYQQLSLERQVHVEITNITPQMLEKIKLIPGISSVTEEVSGLTLEIRETDLEIEVLDEKLHDLGARIRMFQPEVMDMEKVFMKLTQGNVQ